MKKATPKAVPHGSPFRAHLAALIAALLLPSLLLIGLLGHEYNQSEHRRVEEGAHALVRAAVAGIEGEVGKLLATARTLAAAPALQTGNLSDFHDYAGEVGRAIGVAIVLRSDLGAILLDTRRKEGVRAEEPSAAQPRGGYAVSDLVNDAVEGRPTLRVSVPVAAPSLAGSLSVEVVATPDRLNAVLARTPTLPGWTMSVVGRNDIILARNNQPEIFVGRLATRDLREKAQGLAGTWLGSTLEGTPVMGFYARVPSTDWRVAVGVPLPVLKAPIRDSLLWLSGMGFALLALGLLPAFLLARRVGDTVRGLVEAARALGRGEEVRPMRMAVREVGIVADALAAASHDLVARALALKEEKDRLKIALDAGQLGTWDADLRTGLIRRDGRLDALMLDTCVPLKESMGRVSVEDRPAVDEAFAAMLDGHSPGYSVEYRLRVPDGGERWVACRGAIVERDPLSREPVRAAGVTQDITARRLGEERLRDLQAALLRASRVGAMGEMAAGLAHELNQPLAAASNYLEAGTLLFDTAEGPREAIEGAVAQVQRAGRIVRRLRDFVGGGGALMRRENVAEVIEEAVAAALPDGGARSGVTLRFEVEPDAGDALVDRVQLQQVVTNLVVNAVEAMKDEPRRELTVTVGRHAEDGTEVSVADTGPGIAPRVAGRIFEPFVTGKPDGMGIGLAICRTIVEAHGGRLWAESNTDGGTTFRFSLAPARVAVEAA